jgi:hypothetical protein
MGFFVSLRQNPEGSSQVELCGAETVPRFPQLRTKIWKARSEKQLLSNQKGNPCLTQIRPEVASAIMYQPF